MKIIEALKKIKDLQRKAEDLRDKVAKHSAYLDCETPVYQNQPEQVSLWIQSHTDILHEIEALRIAIQRTNLETDVTIELGGKNVTKSIAAWIHRRRDLAELDCEMWKSLTDRKLKEGKFQESTGQAKEVKIVRCYSPEERDKKVFLYSDEPSIIDAKLEITNAVTDLINS